MSFLLKVLTPHEEVMSQQVESATLHDADGEFTMLPHHTHIVKRLDSGVMRYSIRIDERVDGGKDEGDDEGNLEVKQLWTAGGIAEMSREGVLTILTDDVS